MGLLKTLTSISQESLSHGSVLKPRVHNMEFRSIRSGYSRRAAIWKAIHISPYFRCLPVVSTMIILVAAGRDLNYKRESFYSQLHLQYLQGNSFFLLSTGWRNKVTIACVSMNSREQKCSGLFYCCQGRIPVVMDEG